MKLAEALLLRAEQQTHLEELKARAKTVASYQEGEEPAEDAMELVGQADQTLGELERLIRHINQTNAVTALPDGRTMTAALAHRDVLRLRHRLLNDVADAGAHGGRGGLGYARQMRSELKFVIAVPVATLRRREGEVARELRELESLIQQTNWSAELVEN